MNTLSTTTRQPINHALILSTIYGQLLSTIQWQSRQIALMQLKVQEFCDHSNGSTFLDTLYCVRQFCAECQPLLVLEYPAFNPLGFQMVAGCISLLADQKRRQALLHQARCRVATLAGACLLPNLPETIPASSSSGSDFPRLPTAVATTTTLASTDIPHRAYILVLFLALIPLARHYVPILLGLQVPPYEQSWFFDFPSVLFTFVGASHNQSVQMFRKKIGECFGERSSSSHIFLESS